MNMFLLSCCYFSDSYVKKGGESRSKKQRCSCFEPDFLSGS